MKTLQKTTSIFLCFAIVFLSIPSPLAFAEEAAKDATTEETQDNEEVDTAKSEDEASTETAESEENSTVTTQKEETLLKTDSENTGEEETEKEIDSQTTEETKTNTSDEEKSETDPPSGPAPTDADIAIENEAEAENAVDSTSTTGENTVEAKEGDAAVETGEAIATVNLVNILNTNFVNSEGLILFLNSLFGAAPSEIDLRSPDELKENLTCEENGGICTGGGDLSVEIANDASIENEVHLEASTGGNSANSENGSADISTGDAYAAANIVNIANSNFINSEYLILSFSNFGDWDGDLVLPSKYDFNDPSTGSGSGDVDIETDNSADINNSVDIEANTGDNAAASEEGRASISTGDAHTSTGIFNSINQSVFGSGSFSLIVRVHGDWAGEIFSKPDSISYTEGEGFLSFMQSNLEGEAQEEAESAVNESITLTSENNAEINNTLTITSITGDNSAVALGNATVDTGDAYAAANIANIANTNAIGKNWVLAIINIFGDWEGDVAFGRPDLWIGETIEASEAPALSGDTLGYTFTVMNNGDTDATNIVLTDEFMDDYLEIVGSNTAYTVNGDEITWRLGTLQPGEVREVTYEARLKGFYGQVDITNTATISAHEPDENTDDNTETATILVGSPSNNNSGSDIAEELEGSSIMRITTENDAPEEIMGTKKVTYQTTLSNLDDVSSYHTRLVHDLYDPSGKLIHSEVFTLGEVFPREKINVEYTIPFNETFKEGEYETVVYALHTDRSGTMEKETPERTSSVIVEAFTRMSAIARPISNIKSSVTRTVVELISPPVAEASTISMFDSFSSPLYGSQRSQIASASSLGFLSVRETGLLLVSAILLLLATELERKKRIR